MRTVITVLLIMLAVAVCMDLCFDRIFNGWILVLIMTGMSFSVWKGGLHAAAQAFLSMAVPVVLLYPVFMIGGLGAGDIKLLSAVGCFFSLPEASVKDMAMCVMVSFLAGAAFSLLKLVTERSFADRMRYLLSYLHDVFKSGRWELYAQDIQDRKERKKGKIHFALPIFISVVLFAGGIY